MVNCGESFDNGKEDVETNTCGSISKVKKRFLGVNKVRNRFHARVRHPKLKFEISLGFYGSPEEAALVVQKKKVEYAEMFKGENSMKVVGSTNDLDGRKLPSGVYRRGYERWGARIYHPVLKHNVSLGSYSTPDEAAVAVEKGRAEFLRIYGWRGKVNGRPAPGSKENDKVLEEPEHEVVSKSELCDGMISDVKVPRGVRKLQSGKWGSRITDPVTRSRIWLGTFGTAKEAVRSFHKGKAELAAKRKRAELDGFESPVKLDSASSADNLISLSADKSNHEVGEVDVSHEQEHKPVVNLPTSVIVAENPNSTDVQYKEMFKSGNSMKTCRVDFDGRKLPSGVHRRGYARWGTQIYHPMLKRKVSVGSYSTPEKAAFVVQNRRAEFLQMYGWRGTVSHKLSCKDNDKVLEESKLKVVSMPDSSDKLTSNLKVPPGVRRTKSGKWSARISGPVASSRIYLGTFDTLEEAISSVNEGKAEVAAKRKRDEFDGLEGRRKPNSILGADNSNYAVREVNIFAKQEVIELENSNSAHYNDRSVTGQPNEHISSRVSDFEEAIRLGVINEYGELLGEYSELDRQMEFCVPDDDAAGIGYY